VPSEGLTVGPDGTVYTPSFGINSQGAVPGPPHLFSFKPNGQLLYDVALVNPGSPQPSTLLLGLVFQKSSQTLLICDLSNGIVWQANPKTGKATMFMNTGHGSNSGLNALTFDKAGNVYVSDSFLGVIWKTGPNGGPPSMFVDSQTLSPEAATGVILVPPFGADRIASCVDKEAHDGPRVTDPVDGRCGRTSRIERREDAAAVQKAVHDVHTIDKVTDDLTEIIDPKRLRGHCARHLERSDRAGDIDERREICGPQYLVKANHLAGIVGRRSTIPS
jgi:hypothetical protein